MRCGTRCALAALMWRLCHQQGWQPCGGVLQRARGHRGRRSLAREGELHRGAPLECPAGAFALPAPGRGCSHEAAGTASCALTNWSMACVLHVRATLMPACWMALATRRQHFFVSPALLELVIVALGELPCNVMLRCSHGKDCCLRAASQLDDSQLRLKAVQAGRPGALLCTLYAL